MHSKTFLFEGESSSKAFLVSNDESINLTAVSSFKWKGGGKASAHLLYYAKINNQA